MPLRAHEHCLVFYRLLPRYNPQKTTAKPYKATKSKGKFGTNYVTNAEKRDCVSAGHRHPVSVVSFDEKKKRDGTGHPTQKPVALLEWLIKTYSNEGDVVLDPTCGSGTAGVAALKNKRHFIGIEKDPIYFEVAQKRIAETEVAA